MKTAAERQKKAATDFAHALVVAALNRQLHAADNQFVVDALRDLVVKLHTAERAGVDMPLSLMFSDDRLHHDGVPLDGPSLQARSLLRRCAERHIAVLSFTPGIDVDEVNRLFDLLLLPRNAGALARSNRDKALAAFGIRHVQVGLRSPADPGNRCNALDDALRALHTYQDLADCLQDNHVRAHRDLELGLAAAATAVERTVAEIDEPSLLLSLATQDDVDRFTVGHSVRVALLALQVARALGASRDQLVHVGAAALLHDIGKSKVPQEILFKQERLTPEEWAWMSQHPRLGAEILLEQHERVDPRTIGAAFCHHMGPGGHGYPTAMLPVSPSGTSRLVRVCDVFEALTSVRPYKRALTPIEAYAVMFRNESDFDSAWLRRFVRTIGLFPNGSRVRLADGCEAMVVAQTGCPERPTVTLLSGPGDTAVPAGRPERFTIGEPIDGVPARIEQVSTDDRCITIPELDEPDDAPQLPPSHSCWSPQPHGGTEH